MGKANGGHANLLPGTARPPEPRRTHGFWSKTLSPRALEVADSVMEAPWACDMDRLGAEEIGRLVSIIEQLDDRVAKATTRGAESRVETLVGLRLRVSSKLTTLLRLYGLVPYARAEWTARLQAASVWDEIRGMTE